MARDDKPVRLRPVDEEVEEASSVIRLGNRDLRASQVEVPMLRLNPGAPQTEVSRRLTLPDKELVELRTFQPDIGVLMEPEVVDPALLEAQWGEASERKHPVPWGWFVLIALVIAGAVTWSIVRVTEAAPGVVQVRDQSRHELVGEEAEEKEAAELVSKIESTIKSFFAAKTVEALIPFCRQQERVAPLMRSYYATKPLSMGLVREIRSLQPLTLDDRGNFWVATILLDSIGAKNLILEITDSGEVRIDWETLVCHQPMDWDEFVDKRPAGMTMDFRVFAEADNFHSHEFADSNTWSCFKLTALNAEEALFGYARVGNESEKQILSMLERNGGRKVALVVRLIIPEGLKSRRGVVIEKVLSERWIYVNPPDSGS